MSTKITDEVLDKLGHVIDQLVNPGIPEGQPATTGYMLVIFTEHGNGRLAASHVGNVEVAESVDLLRSWCDYHAARIQAMPKKPVPS